MFADWWQGIDASTTRLLTEWQVYRMFDALRGWATFSSARVESWLVEQASRFAPPHR